MPPVLKNAKLPARAPQPAQALRLRLRQLRRQRGLTLEALAARSGLTKSYLSKVERGLAMPSIATVLKVAEALELSVGQLVGEPSEAEVICVVRRNERTPFSRAPGRKDYVYEAIAAARAVKRMQPFVMRPPRRFGRGNSLVEHRGEELIFVLSGAIEVSLGERVVRLVEGDGVYFDASVPHQSRSVGRGQAEALVVVCIAD